MKSKYDVIVIGGGHNGLTAAAYLARAGLEVAVLEQRSLVGGCAVTEELYPGFKFPVCSYVVSLLRPEIIQELELVDQGLTIFPLPSTFCPLPDGRYILRDEDEVATRMRIARFSPRDAEMLPLFSNLMSRLCHFIKEFLTLVPPPIPVSASDFLELLTLSKLFKRLDDELSYELIKLFTMSAADYLEEKFENPHLIASMCVSGIIGTFLGVRSPGTAYVLLHHYMGEIDGTYRAWGLPQGGMGALSTALANAARRFGAHIFTDTPVEGILVKENTAYGVVASDKEISGRIILSSLDPRRTFLHLLPQGSLPSEFTDAIKRYRYRGSSGKVNLAVDKLPSFSCLPGPGVHLRGDISIAPSIDYLERAYDDAKYGNFSRRPFINVVIPSVTDPTVAPPGKHVISCFVQYAPYHITPNPQAWEERREEFGDVVVDTLAEYIPHLKESILYRQVLTPLDLEREFGLTEGNIFHGELSLEQMFFLRPTAGWARYNTPINNLYLCGSGAHPGGGVMGAPGRLASQIVLRDLSQNSSFSSLRSLWQRRK